MTDQPRPRGRPPKGRRRQQISLYLYQEDLAAIDAQRGEQDRNAWIRAAIAEKLARRPTPADAGTAEGA